MTPRLAATMGMSIVTIAFILIIAGLCWNIVDEEVARHYGMAIPFRTRPGTNFALVAYGALALVAAAPLFISRRT